MSPPRIYTRGLRQQLIPSGMIVGRTDSGRGAAHLISLQEIAAALVASGVIESPSVVEEILTVTIGGPFTANQQFVCPPAPRAATFPDATDVSICVATVAPTGNCNLMLCFNPALFLASGGTAGVFAKMAFTAGLLAATVTYPNGGALAAGQVLTFVCPSPADATLSGINISLYGDVT